MINDTQITANFIVARIRGALQSRPYKNRPDRKGQMGQTCFLHGSKQFDMPVSAEQRQFPSQDPAGCGLLWPCRWPRLRKHGNDWARNTQKTSLGSASTTSPAWPGIC